MKTNEGVELLAAHGHLLTCPDEKLLPKSIDCFGTNVVTVRQDGSCAAGQCGVASVGLAL